ncbi:MAG: transcription elongation factor GreA [Candidatus Uhrbacteria bacterium]|nr:transcription elongation factor GreA [Candidatus Uhrbacteria bacterium]
MDQHYVSDEGLQTLKDEVENRKTTLRREIAEKISIAKDQGDLSENFEYQDAKDQQAENETRILYLEELIKSAVVVERREGESTINVGSKFIVETADGGTKEFELVGATETDPLSGKISNESPLGNKFIGSSIGDTIKMETPGGAMTYKIISIE